MSGEFKSLGVRDAFQSGTADLSGVGGRPRGIAIARIVHKAFVEVNEEGTEAAAATAVTEVYTCSRDSDRPSPPTFRADHPFVFLIRHKPSGAVLFIGRLGVRSIGLFGSFVRNEQTPSSDVDIRVEFSVKTSKTCAAVTLPIMDTLRAVLESALAEREEGAAFVFPDAERMLRENDTGITYRVKKVFARAFAMPQDADQIDADAPERVTLADLLPDVLKAVQLQITDPRGRVCPVRIAQQRHGGSEVKPLTSWRAIKPARQERVVPARERACGSLRNPESRLPCKFMENALPCPGDTRPLRHHGGAQFPAHARELDLLPEERQLQPAAKA